MEKDLATSDIVVTNRLVDASPAAIGRERGVRPTAPINTVTTDQGTQTRNARGDVGRQLCALGESRRSPRLQHSPGLSADAGPSDGNTP